MNKIYDYVLMFIPILGRFFVTDDLKKRYEHIHVPRKWKIAYLFENTILYCLLGCFGSYFAHLPFSDFGIMMGCLWLVGGYIEYKMMQKKPEKFSNHCHIPPTRLEFAWLLYHALWFMLLGYAIGTLFN